MILNYLQHEFEKHGANTSGWLNTINYILERISRSPSIDGLAEEAIVNWINESGGSRLTKATMKKRLQELRHGDVKGVDHTEVANLALARIEETGALKYHNSKFWQWCGSHWEEKERDELLGVIAREFGSLMAAKRRADHKGILDIMGTLRRGELQTDSRNGVNFANGFLTEELKLMPHDPAFGCTYTLPYRYLPEQADNGKQWNQFLDRMWTHPENGPDEDITDKKLAIQEAIAVTLFGIGTRYARAILLHGLSHTGKSQLLNVVTGLLPPSQVSAVKPEDWSDKFLPSRMANKLLNIAGELSEKNLIDGQSFKQIVAGDTITGQHKGLEPFEFRPKATHWFGSNHLPKSRDATAAFNRRWLIVTFNHPIRKEEKIPNIANILIADEREQIVSWAMRAMPRLLANSDFTLPKSHVEMIERVANENDSVRYFLTESPEVRLDPLGEKARVSGGKTSLRISEIKLYDAYSSCPLFTYRSVPWPWMQGLLDG